MSGATETAEGRVRVLLLVVIVGLAGYLGRNLVGRLLGAETRTTDVVAPVGALAEDEKRTIAIFENVSPAVVFITTLDWRDRFTDQLETVGFGSGFIWDDQHVVTNFHVVSDQRGQKLPCTVSLKDGSEGAAEVVGSDPDNDVAVLRVHGLDLSKMRRVAVGSSKDLRVGQRAFVIGNPRGRDYTLTSGLISALNRTLQTVGSRRPIYGVIQTDAPINPGNSGGPLLDSGGRVIGIVTAMDQNAQNLGFAIPVDRVRDIVDDLIVHGRVKKAGLGIRPYADWECRRYCDRFDIPHGLLIEGVSPGSVAERIGLRLPSRRILGDVIVGIDSRRIVTREDLLRELDRRRVGDRVTLKVYRDGGEIPLSVVLQESSLERW